MTTPARSVAIANGISHSYKAVTALDNIDVGIPAGKIVGLIGPDSVGKSTLLGLIAGARKLQQGRLTVLGGSIADMAHRRAIQPRIAYMPQGLGKNLYGDLSVAENLEYFGRLFTQPKDERQQRIAWLTKSTGLFHFLDRPAAKLSGGMKQKLGLCCALIHDPDLLILDEPTTGVDPLSRRQFWELITSITAERPEMSLLVSSAYMEEAEAFDWLIAMNDGRIIGTGEPSLLMEQTGSGTLEAAYVALLPGRSRQLQGDVPVPPKLSDDGEPAIIARDLVRKFGDFTAVDKVSFTIRRGEIFGFLGSNGCGKTTTMKILTGLLPPSAGEATLFGQTVEAGSRAIRRRVGYMSQSFSLYGELTVSQNLHLHARLFHLDREQTRQRIDRLVEQFRLDLHLDQLASQLPLGVRQRLSLAVAILHEPEMLILDEPTSGVDPLSRDEFWRLLTNLSRKDNVTIFISTHFMNEAMRCDRISLMHGGKVLAVGTPDELIETKKADSLDEAFIEYMLAAPGNHMRDDGQAAPVKSDVTRQSKSRQDAHYASFLPQSWWHSLMRLFANTSRESKEILRDPVRLAFAFVGSTVLLFIFSYGITTDVNQVRFAVLDHDRSPESRAYLAQFRGSRYFQELDELSGIGDLEARLKAHDISLAIEVPPDFGRNLKRGGKAQISAWIDGANTPRASTVSGYIAGVHELFLQNRAHERSQPTGASLPAEIQTRYLYNPSFESIYAIGPSVPAMMLILFPAILMAVSVVREKEIGTVTNFYVTPTRRFEFLIGKQLPYIAIAMANFFIMAFVVIYIFGVPLKGSFAALTLGALFYAAATTSYGLLIATITSSQVAAVFATAILSIMPTFQFSGFMIPVSSLEDSAWVMGTLWPATYFMHLSVGAFTKGLPLEDLFPDILALMAFTPPLLLIASLGLRKQER